MSNVYELNGFIEENGGKQPFSLVVSEAKKSDEAEDYFCVVHAPALFKRDKSIYGSDADQACELAVNFVKTLLEGKKIIDSDGNAMAI